MKQHHREMTNWGAWAALCLFLLACGESTTDSTGAQAGGSSPGGAGSAGAAGSGAGGTQAGGQGGAENSGGSTAGGSAGNAGSSAGHAGSGAGHAGSGAGNAGSGACPAIWSIKGCQSSGPFVTSAVAADGSITLSSQGMADFCPGASIYLEQGMPTGDFSATLTFADFHAPAMSSVILSLAGDSFGNEFSAFNLTPSGSYVELGTGAGFSYYDPPDGAPIASAGTLTITRQGSLITTSATIAGDTSTETNTAQLGPFSLIIQLRVEQDDIPSTTGLTSVRLTSFTFDGSGASSDNFACDSLKK
jgi:hypothetical protein